MKRMILLLFMISMQRVEAQPVASVVKSQALEMGKAMVAGDSKTFARFMLPELLQEGGGAEKVIGMMDSAFAMFRQFGGEVSRITYGNPGKIISYKKELQTTLPQTTSITSSIADAEFSSTLVAISRDNGKNWFFLDPNMGKSKQLKDKLPPLSPELVIPPMGTPKIIPKQQQ